MELVLYDESDGYYSSPERRTVGRKGDFYTSVSVGEMFGFLLSQQIQKCREEFFEPKQPFSIVEQGAHDGQLALDILSGLREDGEDSVRYRIVDPRPATREWLSRRFEEAGFGEQVKIVATLEEASAEQGIFLCNELLDAFPFHRLRLGESGWEELQVGCEKGHLCFTGRPLSEGMQKYAVRIGDNLPLGYTTEVCPLAESWLKEAAGLFERGFWWIIDYGHEAPDYFSPHRSDGTFRCYRDHRASEDPFDHLGETDITAHVNFTFLENAAEECGLKWRKLTDQHHFLIGAARDWLLSIEGQTSAGQDPGSAKRLRQFQTLTHPGMMGTQFKVAVLSKGISS
ncbi:MAG: SAM-dependent methyltransferase [Verrucomicrobiota bacterium]